MQIGNATILHGNSLELLPTLEENSIDAVVTDPPYGLSSLSPQQLADTMTRWASGERDYIPAGKGFMGKSWDAFVPPPALWDEVYRVLKPGGHALVFAGSRTQDLMGLSLRLAGFEVRDVLQWIYGAGFPKSHDIAKAIDKSDASEARRKRDLEFTAWMRTTGLTSGQIDEITGTNMGGHYLTSASQPAVATADLFDKLRPYLPEVPDYIEAMVVQRTIESENFKRREVIGQQKNAMAGWNMDGTTKFVDRDITAPATREAQKWQGWGTALKPAFEPVIVARKPLIGTVAENVLTYGTGGINIDGSRIGRAGGDNSHAGNRTATFGTQETHSGGDGSGGWTQNGGGRWPANILLDEEAARLLDEQSGVSKSNGGKNTPNPNGSMFGAGGGVGYSAGGFGDIGGASRFFYTAKASKRDRNEGLDFQSGHPTVKPTDLMRYLCKLITPPNGIILDPFTGSGSTGKAALLDGFRFIGIEMTDEYLPIIEGRLKHAAKTAEELKHAEQKRKKETLFD